MAERATMAELITELRALTDAGADDHQIGGVTFWSDQQLQDVLDRNRTTIRREALQPDGEYNAGAWLYYDYPIPAELGAIERAGTGGGFALRDASGNDAPAHTINYAAGVITFDDDTGGDVYYLDCRGYDMNAAAAAVWEQKAGFVAASVDWKADNHAISASQEHDHCMERARHFRSRAGGGVQVIEFFRSDENF